MMVIDLTNGAIVHWLRFEGIVTELYDVQVIPEVQRPMAFGFQTDEIAQLITWEFSPQMVADVRGLTQINVDLDLRARAFFCRFLLNGRDHFF